MKTIAGQSGPDGMGPTAHLLSEGTRLHLQHGPIDLIIGADGSREVAFAAAVERFETVLEELVAELPELRMEVSPTMPAPEGFVARRMHCAALAFCQSIFVTRMAAVAGSVADEVLQAMVSATDLERAYVNNGGDIALHLSEGAQFITAMQSHEGRDLGSIRITSDDPVRGIATSGRHGRSLSLGIADSVTVLSENAARADVAATLIANAVDLPGHPAISRRAAQELSVESDLGARSVVLGCGRLTPGDRVTALNAGLARANQFKSRNLIAGAAIYLQSRAMTTNSHMFPTQTPELFHA